jgi:hypothetical protein
LASRPGGCERGLLGRPYFPLLLNKFADGAADLCRNSRPAIASPLLKPAVNFFACLSANTNFALFHGGHAIDPQCLVSIGRDENLICSFPDVNVSKSGHQQKENTKKRLRHSYNLDSADSEGREQFFCIKEYVAT